MSRSTTALKRLGVPGLAAVTAVAGLPLFLGTAQAATIGTITIAPATTTGPNANGTGAAGACIPFRITTTPATAGQSTVGETVVVNLTDVVSGNAAGDNASNPQFCTVATGTNQPASGTAISTSGAATGGGTTDVARFTLTAGTDDPATAADESRNGTVVFGVVNNQQGVVTTTAPGNGTTEDTDDGVDAADRTATVFAFADANNNNEFTAGESRSNNQTVTFTEGGPAGSNAAANAVENITVADASGDASDANVVAGETRTYRLTLTNSSGDAVPGVTPFFTVTNTGAGLTAGNQGPAPCSTASNNAGIVDCTITFAQTGAFALDFYVNQTDGTTAADEAGEPDVQATATVGAAPTARTLTLTPLADEENTGAGASPQYQTQPAINPRTDGDRTFRVVVDNASGAGTANTAGTQLTLTVSGGDGDEIITPAGGAGDADGSTEASTVDFTTVAGDTSSNTTNSFLDFVVRDPDEATAAGVPSGQVLTVTATVRGQAATDTETLTFVAVPADARNIDLTPETATTTVNTARTFTARVVDFRGNPVGNVPVDFTESGPGAFRNGSSQINDVLTDRNGEAAVEVIALAGEQGQQTITATIDATAGTAQAAGTPAGTTRAGNRSDTSTNNIVTSTTPPTTAPPTTAPPTSPAATSTATTAPPTTGAPQCNVTPTVTLERTTITATGSTGVTVNAPANSQIQLFAYSRPSTTYKVVREAVINASGDAAQFRIVPPTNTRLYAQVVGCDTDESRFSVVLNVRTQLSLNVVRNGTRNYTFSGRALPARAGGLIVSLYRVTNDGRQILAAQTRADASTGRYTINRKFTGNGRFGFVVRTGQDLQNAPGVSNVRSLLVF